MSALFLKRKPGGALPPGIDVTGTSDSLRALLAAFATDEIESAAAG